MIYLDSFKLLDKDAEYGIISNKLNIYNNLYPLRVFSNKELTYIEFEHITIFYGGNGSGKSTILNIISDTINASKKNIDKRNELFNHM